MARIASGDFWFPFTGGLYPGAEYLDIVAVDGFNWVTTSPDTSWLRPAELFDATLAEVRAVRCIAGTSERCQRGPKAPFMNVISSVRRKWSAPRR